MFPLIPKHNKPHRRTRKVSVMEANVLPIDDNMQASVAYVLLDTGCTSSMIHHTKVPRQYWEKLKRPVVFTTKGGEFKVK